MLRFTGRSRRLEFVLFFVVPHPHLPAPVTSFANPICFSLPIPLPISLRPLVSHVQPCVCNLLTISANGNTASRSLMRGSFYVTGPICHATLCHSRSSLQNLGCNLSTATLCLLRQRGRKWLVQLTSNYIERGKSPVPQSCFNAGIIASFIRNAVSASESSDG